MTLVSQAEYARHRSVSRKTVTAWKKEGRLVWQDGKIDLEASDELLDGQRPPGNSDEVKGNETPAGNDAPPVAQPAEKPETHEGLRALLDRLDLMTKAEAEQVKENYLALQRRLEYEKAAGELVPVDEAAQKVAEEYAAVRSNLLSLPTKLAPHIAQKTGGDANQIRENLAEGITRALEELTHDAGGDGS